MRVIRHQFATFGNRPFKFWSGFVSIVILTSYFQGFIGAAGLRGILSTRIFQQNEVLNNKGTQQDPKSMAVYYINSYDIVNMEEFQKYGPMVRPIILKYGGEVLAADIEGIAVEGSPKRMNAIIKFPSKVAALNCYNDSLYQNGVRQIRLNSTNE